MHSEIITRIRQDLAVNADEETKKSSRRFFKENVQLHGVRSSPVRKISQQYFREIRGGDKKWIFALCEELLQSGYFEEAVIAYDWAHRIHARFEPGDFSVLEGWLSHYVSNWAECDTLCNHAVGSFIEQYPEFLSRLKSWARSGNRWIRRGAAVSLVLPARKGKFLEEIFGIADILLKDPEDMVQKGYGWMLKEASKSHRDEIFAYVMRHKHEMPRTALRYAIEKMPVEMRKQAMEK
ncbi:MAG: DNA alkylation repair protein [Methanomicrobiaceae archaeon]|nr:DNA alkylation repair protein [Methanomicrobiaceae archaeon]